MVFFGMCSSHKNVGTISRRMARFAPPPPAPRPPIKAGAIRISGGNGSWGEPGGTLVLRNCTFDANLADQGQGGVFYLAEYSMVTVEGDDNVFTNNYSGDNGGVIATTSDTRIMVQGGNFSGNFGDEVRQRCCSGMYVGP